VTSHDAGDLEEGELQETDRKKRKNSRLAWKMSNTSLQENEDQDILQERMETTGVNRKRKGTPDSRDASAIKLVDELSEGEQRAPEQFKKPRRRKL
jgi:hypothetical protein